MVKVLEGRGLEGLRSSGKEIVVLVIGAVVRGLG